MRTIKLLIAFDGTGYCGWQRQGNGPTIQAELERAVAVICNRATTVHGAGRTDAGVHALGMTAHFRTGSRVTCEAFQKGLNSLLPTAIRILQADEADPAFHARFSARAKTYRYTVCTAPVLAPCRRLYSHHVPYPLAREAMRSCLAKVTGEHDFSSFETAGSRDRQASGGRGAVRTMFKAELKRPESDYLHLVFTGDGFLRHMVRNLTGTIIEVGRGKRTPAEFEAVLAARNRNLAGATAPSRGLCLTTVHYEDPR